MRKKSKTTKTKQQRTTKRKTARRPKKRPQREIDLEALDLQRQGYSVREIAGKQRVHLNTAFDRIKRGLAIEQAEQSDTPPTEAEWLDSQRSKLRELERAFWPQAVDGDLQALWGVMRVMREYGRLAVKAPKPLHPFDVSRQRMRRGQAAAEPSYAESDTQGAPTNPRGPASPSQKQSAAYDPWKFLHHRAQTGDWGYYAELLPHRHDEIIRLRDELNAEECKQERARRRALAGLPPEAEAAPNLHHPATDPLADSKGDVEPGNEDLAPHHGRGVSIPVPAPSEQDARRAAYKAELKAIRDQQAAQQAQWERKWAAHMAGTPENAAEPGDTNRERGANANTAIAAEKCNVEQTGANAGANSGANAQRPQLAEKPHSIPKQGPPVPWTSLAPGEQRLADSPGAPGCPTD